MDMSCKKNNFKNTYYSTIIEAVKVKGQGLQTFERFVSVYMSIKLNVSGYCIHFS